MNNSSNSHQPTANSQQPTTSSSFHAQTPPLITRLTPKEMAETVLFDITGSIIKSFPNDETIYSKLKTKKY
jgi:hypothetical protein